jgi:outer membrane lipoprotein-sorting protein
MRFPITFARALAPLAIVAAAAGPATAQTDDMAKVRAHLGSVQSMTANFTQTDARGRSAGGTLQIKKPGRIRFEYGSGDLLLVGNGKTLTFVDYEVGQKSSWPLNKTPLGVLLSGSPDLKGRAQVIKSDDPRVVVVRARDPVQFGSLVLAFLRSPSAPGGLMLHGWTAIDAQNKRTTVKLTNQRYNVAVAETAFRYAEPKKKSRS